MRARGFYRSPEGPGGGHGKPPGSAGRKSNFNPSLKVAAREIKAKRVPEHERRLQLLLAEPQMRSFAERVSDAERRTIKALSSGSPLERVLAVHEFGRGKTREHARILESLLRDKTIFTVTPQESAMFRIPMRGLVRDEALWSLVAMGSKVSVPLIERMLRDPEPGVRESAREALLLLTDNLKYHRLYQQVLDDPSFFDIRQKKIPKREFGKTGSRLILLGGRMAGKQVIRVLPEESFNAMKRALDAKEVWMQKFGYVPIEPMAKLPNGKEKYFRTKDGHIGVYVEVLGMSLGDYVIKHAMESGELAEFRIATEHGDQTATERFYNPEGLTDMAEEINKTLRSLGIVHGHEHPWNFCVRMHEGKPRLYFIDFDRAKIVQ
ncbi:MAG: HEAT repeat domain-containing protein [Candidatus Diapherotrites archaeon]